MKTKVPTKMIETILRTSCSMRERVSALAKAVEVQISRELSPQGAAPAAHSALRKGDIVLLTALTLLSLFLRITWALTRNVVHEMW